MQSIQRGPTRDELDARVRELRLQAWRRRSIAAIVSAALAASSMTPAVALAEPGGWDGGAPSSSESSASAGGIGSDAGATGDGGYSGSSLDSSGGGISSPSDAGDAAGPSSSAGSGETSGYGSSTSSSIGSSDSSGGGISSPSDAADAAGPSTSSSSGGGGIGSDHAASANAGGGISSPSDAADAAPAASEPQTGGLDPDSRDSVPDVAPAATKDTSMPAVTAMGDATGYTQDQTTTTEAAEPQTGGLDPDSRDSVPDVAPAEDTSMPAVTAMGDATGYTQDQTTTTTDTVSSPQEAVDAAPAKSTETSTYEAPVTTAMGDNTGFTETVEAPAADTTPADPGSLPATTPMGDATGYTLDDVAQPTLAEPAQPAPTTPDATPTGWQASVTAAWGLGGTVGVAHDNEYTSITIGPAEGVGFFGSVGQANAAHQTTPGASVKGGLGFVSGELSVDQTAITGKANLNVPINPGINQTVASYTGKINPDLSVSGYKTEGMSYGQQVGLATTQTVTIAIPNSAFETVANWLGLGPEKPGTGGGW